MKNPSATKVGPGRRRLPPPDWLEQVVRTEAPPAKMLKANVGREPRRPWRVGEPVHICKPVRREWARLKALNLAAEE